MMTKGLGVLRRQMWPPAADGQDGLTSEERSLCIYDRKHRGVPETKKIRGGAGVMGAVQGLGDSRKARCPSESFIFSMA